MQVLKVIVLIIFLMVIIACGEGSSSSNQDDTQPPQTDSTALSPPSAQRDWLTYEHLMSSSYPHYSPIHNEYFMPVGNSSSALHPFSGTIDINTRRLIGAFEEFYIARDESFKNFPDVDLSFVSDGDALIPLNRNRQISLNDNSYWGVILEPGKIWSEIDDQGWSRASFPFTFISARRNQGHNGLATFLFNDTQISHLRIQIVQETASWFKQDIYAQLSVSYIPKEFVNTTRVKEAYQSEIDNTVELRAWDKLDIIGSSQLQFNSSLNTSSISQTGLIKDNVVFLQPCYTRYGEYPYCRWMRNGAYSITKSLGASIAMMRLAQLYGEQVYDLKIVDYLNVTSTHDGWEGVTFGDTLNMAAGIGDEGTVQGSGNIFADENGPKMETWLGQHSEIAKLNVSFSYGNYSWGPGQVVRYNSATTFVLAAALDNYYKSVAGLEAHLWEMITTDVYNAIGIQHVPMLETNEPGGIRGIAELFHGLYPNVDDIAKLTLLLQNDGIHDGVQILHPQKVRESLFKTSNDGLHGWWEDNQYGESKYLNGFWSSPFRSTTGCFLQVPYMSGFGGNIFAVFPNGAAAFRFADAGSYSPGNMIVQSDRERPICE
ncbi:MAG: hypothetical protein HWE27_09120 [Gammaproteobacteria bacterium]|nr:hypothetical protein [Gammaproteobacteria bacterium]